METVCASPKSILKKPGTPKSARARNVEFVAEVSIIGANDKLPLLAPDSTRDELVFDANPPVSAPEPEPNWTGRTGTMRIKGSALASLVSSAQSTTSGTSNKAATSSNANSSEEKRAPGILEGYLKLLKETGMKSSWMKRYIVLSSDSLSYYRSADTTKPLKSITLTTDCYVRETSHRTGVSDCLNSLEIFFGKGNNIVLKGATQREATEWMTAICAAVDALRPPGHSDDDDFEFVDDEDDEPIEKSINRAMEHAPFSLSTAVANPKALEQDEIEWWDEDEEMYDLPPIEPASTPKPAPTSAIASSSVSNSTSSNPAPKTEPKKPEPPKEEPKRAEPQIKPQHRGTMYRPPATATVNSTVPAVKSFAAPAAKATAPAVKAAPSSKPLGTSVGLGRPGATVGPKASANLAKSAGVASSNANASAASAASAASGVDTQARPRGKVSDLLKMWEQK